ncbi:MAG: hypothetical protein RDV48_21170 [Candidatus Eremiobacteraeota bacterium]|nr:hypothetical protein [Candidatus Eremiobacteraeota bacterium]
MKSQWSFKKTRILTGLALVAAVNCLFETTMGNFLHMVKFPFTGAVMLGFNVVAYVLARWICPRPGAISAVAFITVLGNIAVGAGMIKPFALAAILCEGILIDIVIFVIGFRQMGVVAASVAAYFFAFLYPLLTAFLFVRKEVPKALASLISGVHADAAVPFAVFLALILLKLLIYCIIAVFFGVLGWRLFLFMEKARSAHALSME